MQISAMQVVAEQGGSFGFTVEFIGTQGDVVSVLVRNDHARTLTRYSAVAKAQDMMRDLGEQEIDPALMDGGASTPADSLAASQTGLHHAIEHRDLTGRKKDQLTRFAMMRMDGKNAARPR